MFKRVLILVVVLLGAFSVMAQSVKPEDLAEPGGVFIQVNGATLYYVDRGLVDAPVVILVHGFLGSTENWQPVIPALVEAGYRVIAFDRPPFGLADKSTKLDYSQKAQADLVIGLMDALDIPQADLIGHSAGGLVVGLTALLYPERVHKLIIEDGAIGLDAMGSNGGPNPFMTLLKNIDPDSKRAQAMMSQMLELPMIKAQLNDPNMPSMEMLQLDGWQGGLLAFSKAMLNEENPLSAAMMADVKTPTLLIWGQDDELVPLPLGEALRDAMPNAQWITYPNVGHTPMWSVPKQFNADVIAFLASTV